MFNKLRQNIANLINPTAKNSMSLPNQFMRYGQKGMTADWTQVIMNDRDLYTGYTYAAIRKRANATARVAMEHLKSKTTTNEDNFIHPYLKILESSPTFSDYQFWYNISTYLDLEGVFYLLAIRNFSGNRFGAIKEFKLLNPYDINRVVKTDEFGRVVVGGYIETRDGLTRELPPEMVIEMRELNPFNQNEPYAMTDAAKESQFTIKTAGDYTRQSLRHNINAPGILSTDVQLSPENFANFVSRVKNNVKGEPIFGNGQGAIDYKSMDIDLNKSALKDVTEVNREALFAVTGMSKTTMGIEQSGTTRETSKVQKDMLIEGEILPRIQTIIDPLNQDYRNHYPQEFSNTGAEIIIENPNASDHEAEAKEVETKQKKADLYSDLLAQGYNPKKVADYVEGRIEIQDLGIPTNPKSKTADKPAAEQAEFHVHELNEKKNELSADESGQVKAQEGALQNAVVNLDQAIVAECINKIRKNDFNEESDVISKSKKKSFINELELVLVGFYGVLMQLQGGKTMRSRMGEFALGGVFTLDAQTKNYIKEISRKVSESHVETVINDVLVAAREAALAGGGQKEIVNAILMKYDKTITETRAKTIARTETNRAFTRAQFEADRQFIKQNKLSKRAYKRWRTRSDNPCVFCESLANGPLIPFSNAFAELGTDINVDGEKLPVNFETLEAGNAHPNCSCIYELVILAQ